MDSIQFLHDMTNQFGKTTFLEDLKAQKGEISNKLQSKGAVLIRNTSLRETNDFKSAALAFSDKVVEYTGAKVRQNACDNVLYTPTSTPAHRINFLHHELAYQNKIPGTLVLMCQKQAPTGGESILGDAHEVYKTISPAIREEIETRGLKFQRVFANRSKLQNYLSQKSALFALVPSWQGNWNTEDPNEAEAKAKAQGLDFKWTKQGHMILSCNVSPVRKHPVTGEKLWTNNAHVFQLHKKVFGTQIYYLFKLFFKLTGSPMTTCYFGDGEKIPDHYTEEILNATLASQKRILLQAGDLIFINNISIAHGRLPFKGPRRLFFAAYE